MSKTPGQACYEKFSEEAELPDIDWSKITPESQEKWQRIADAAIDQHITNCEALGRD